MTNTKVPLKEAKFATFESVVTLPLFVWNSAGVCQFSDTREYAEIDGHGDRLCGFP